MGSEELEELKSRVRPMAQRCCFLFAVIVAYLFLGGLIFQLAEHEAREDAVEQGIEELEEGRADLLRGLWAETVAKTEEEWMLVGNERMEMYEKVLRDQLGQGIDLDDDEDEDGEEDEDDDNPWTLLGSIFYSFTILTTIGYGNLFPVTLIGRLLTIVYGMIGIPLTLVYLGEVGKVLTLLLKFLLRKKWPDYDDSEDFNFAPGMAVGLTVTYLFLGGILFDLLEDDWDILDATYFSFITYSTVGFGDLVPEGQGWMLLLMVYSLSALSLCAMCFTILQCSLDEILTQKQEALSEWWEAFKEQRRIAKSKKTDADTSADDNTTTIDYSGGSSSGGYGNSGSYGGWSATADVEGEEEEEG